MKSYLNSTRTENDFVEAVKALVAMDPDAPWTFVCDGLNTHKSETLVRFVAESCAIEMQLGLKGKKRNPEKHGKPGRFPT